MAQIKITRIDFSDPEHSQQDRLTAGDNVDQTFIDRLSTDVVDSPEKTTTDEDTANILTDPIFDKIKDTIKCNLEKRSSTSSIISSTTGEEEYVQISEHYTSIPFGVQPKTTYDHGKNNSDIMGVAYNGRMRQFIFLDAKGITTWKRDAVEKRVARAYLFPKYEYRMFTHILYVRKFNCYFVLTRDFSLKVFNRDFEETCSVHADLRSILFMLFNPLKDELITGGVGGTKFWTFHQVSENAFQDLKPMANYRLTLKYELPDVGGSWVKRVELDYNLEHLYCCSDTDLNVYNLQGKLLFKFKQAHKMTITGCRYSMSAKVLVTSSIDCDVKVWSMTGGLVHTFRGHSRAVTNLMIHPDNSSIIITTSLDGSIRMWCLETLESVYSLVISTEGILWMGLTDDEMLYICTCKHLTLWSLNYYYEYWSTARSKLSTMSLVGCTNKTTRIVTIGDDNSVRLFARKTQKNLCTILPPPDLSPLEKISSMCYSREFNVAFLLINRDESKINEIWVYTTRTDPSCRIAVWSVRELQIPYLMRRQKTENPEGFSAASLYNNQNGGPVYRATENGSGNESLTFCHCLCILNSSALMLTDEGLSCPIRHSYLLLGMEDGRVFFMDPVVKGQKYMEFKASKDSILAISHDPVHNSLVTLSKLKYLTQIRIWMLPTLFLQHEVYCALDIVDYTRINNSFLTGHKSGCLILHVLEPLIDNGFHKTRSVPEFGDVVDIYKRPEHTECIICIDSSASMKIFCSCSIEGVIKIWDEDKNLLTEIMMDETLSAVLFLNNKADLILGFKNHIFFIDHSKVCPHLNPSEVDDYDEFDKESLVYEDPAVTFEGIGANPDPIDINQYLIPYEIEFSKDFLEGKPLWESSSEDEIEISDLDSEYSMAPTETYLSPPETPGKLANIDLMVGSDITNYDLKTQMLFTMQQLYDKGFTHNLKRKRKKKKKESYINLSDGETDIEDEIERWRFSFPKFGRSPGPSPTLSFPSTTSSIDSDADSDVSYEEIVGRDGKIRKKKKAKMFFKPIDPAGVSAHSVTVGKAKSRYRGDYAEGESSGIGDVRLDVKTLLKKAAEEQKKESDHSHVRAEIDEHVSNLVRKQRDILKKKVTKRRKPKQGQKIPAKTEKTEEKLKPKESVPIPVEIAEKTLSEEVTNTDTVTLVTLPDATKIEQRDREPQNIPHVDAIPIPDLPKVKELPEKTPVVKKFVPLPRKNMMEFFDLQKPGIGKSPTSELEQQDSETTGTINEETAGIKKTSVTSYGTGSVNDEIDDIAYRIMMKSPDHSDEDSLEGSEQWIGKQIEIKILSPDSGWADGESGHVDKPDKDVKHSLNIQDGEVKKRPLSSFVERRIHKANLKGQQRPSTATEIRQVREKEDLHVAFNEAYHRYQHLSSIPVTPNNLHKNNDLTFDDNWHERFIERHMLLRMQKELRAHEAALKRKQMKEEQQDKHKYILGLYDFDEDFQDPGEYQHYHPSDKLTPHPPRTKKYRHMKEMPHPPQTTPTNSRPHTALPANRCSSISSKHEHSHYKSDKPRPQTAATYGNKEIDSRAQETFKYGRYSQGGMYDEGPELQNKGPYSMNEIKKERLPINKGGDSTTNIRTQTSSHNKHGTILDKSRPQTVVDHYDKHRNKCGNASLKLDSDTERILKSLSRYDRSDGNTADIENHNGRIDTPYRLHFGKDASVNQNITKHRQVGFDVKHMDPRNPKAIRPKSSKSIPSKCSQYVLLSKPKEKLTYPLPTPLEEQLLAERFPILGHKVYDHYDGLIIRHRKPEYNIEYTPFARELYG